MTYQEQRRQDIMWGEGKAATSDVSCGAAITLQIIQNRWETFIVITPVAPGITQLYPVCLACLKHATATPPGAIASTKSEYPAVRSIFRGGNNYKELS